MENKSWKEIGFSEKTKLTLSIILITASIILGFLSFVMLKEIPGSVLAQGGLWMSTALALLGITSYFNNELVKMGVKVNDKINELNEAETEIRKRYKEEETQ